MVATPVKIGPFAGGLNSYSDPSAVGDAEVTDIQNFDIDFDGSLYSRAPITTLYSPGTGNALQPLGWFIDTDGTRYFIYTNGNITYARNETNGTVGQIALQPMQAVVQYDKKLWLTGLVECGSWSPSGGYTVIAAIPKGTTLAIFKERLFVSGVTANPNRIYFSNAADFTTWNTSVNFFDVRAGDGQTVLKLQVFQDVIGVFKNDSTYIFSYDSNPSRGVARIVNGSVGITNAFCIVEYETSLYVLHEGKLYQISNWNFTMVNMKVPFVQYVAYASLTKFPITLSVLSDRLVVHYFDNIYVFNLRVGTWTKWFVDVDHTFNFFLEVPRSSSSEPERYYAGCRADSGAGRALFEWRPIHDSSRSETMTCYVQTKVFDMNVPYQYKRLFWWGADIVSDKDISWKLQPVTYTTAVTHQMLAAYTHQQITGSHLRPLSISLDITAVETVQNPTAYRMFIKFPKSLRFRQVSFNLGGTTDGTTAQGPLRIYSVIAFMDSKAIVGAKVS